MKVLIGLELQIPFHDRGHVSAFMDFVKDYQPDKLIIIGDFLDCPAPARWNRGTAEEYAGGLQNECDTAKCILDRLRTVYDGFIGYHIGNHEARINTYAKTKAPAFADLEALRVASLLDFKGYEVTELPTFFAPLPGLLTTHGDSGTTSKYGGGTALSLARIQGMSVVCGHTHRHGIIYERFGRKTVFGMETGHGMSVARAGYIPHGNPNWSSGWGIVEYHNGHLWPSIITYRNGKVQHGRK